ncbi:MAG: hypothetical protein ABIK09_17450 [Pseudomonadota bacterium]
MIRTMCFALAMLALTWAPLGCDQDNPKADTATPVEDTIAPPEDTVLIPPEDTFLPPEDTVTPPPEDTIEPPPEDTVEPPDCVKEGKMGSNMMTPMECCEGLDAISVTSWDPAFPEMCGMMSDVFLCAKCGNDHCETDWENPCNCVADCPFPEPGGDQALCAGTGGIWTGCGSGCGPWSCGESYPEICPAVCIPQCACPPVAGWDAEKGCVTCTCGEWSETWGAVLQQVQACQAAEDCVDVPATSCGCTMNYVVNKSVDLWMFWQVSEAMNAAGCGPFMSTCSCPAADGFKCENGICGWNYL